MCGARAFYVARTRRGVPRLRHEERVKRTDGRTDENGRTDGRPARRGASLRSKSTDSVGALRRCITVGVTGASAAPFRPLSPANVGVTEYLLSVRISPHSREGRKACASRARAHVFTLSCTTSFLRLSSS